MTKGPWRWSPEGGLKHRLSIAKHDVKYYGKRWRLVALIRVLWLTLVVRHYGESCQVCGRSYIHWVAPSRLYIEVKGNSGGTFCPSCFDVMCRDKGIRPLWTVEPFTMEAVEREWSKK